MEMQISYLSKAEKAFCKHWQGRKYISMHISGRERAVSHKFVG